jgi:hypothetical protein
MEKYQVKVNVEAYVWLDADNAKEAKFMAEDIATAGAGKMLSRVLYDIEVCGSEASDVFVVAEGTGGVLTQNTINDKTN